MVGEKGFDVETASTSARARKILLSKEFDLVISDLRLPDQDGINLLSWLREQKKNIPFIIMTGYAEIQSAVQCMKLGATDYISKPIQPDELLKKSTKPSHSPIKKPKKQKISCCLLPQIFWKEKVKLHNSCSTTYVW